MNLKMNLSNITWEKIFMGVVLCFVLVFITTKVYAALSLNATTITSDGSLTLSPASNLIVSDNVDVGIGTSNPNALLQVVQPTAGLGLVSVTAGSTAITGTNTQFLNTFASNSITITTSAGSETLQIASITSDTLMTAGVPFAGSASNVPYTIDGGNRFSVRGNGDIYLGGGISSASLFPNFGTLWLRTNPHNADPVLSNFDMGSQPSLVFQDHTFDLKAMRMSFITDGTALGTKMTTYNSGFTPIYTLTEAGNVGIGNETPNAKLDINSDSMILETPKTPASSTAACITGTIAWDANFVYVCVATNTWKRSSITTW